MSTTPGRRVYPDAEGNLCLQPGDYDCDVDGLLFLRPPRGGAGVLDGHAVTVHEDGTISVSPSIHLVGVWHGYLERGVWREV